MTPIHLFDIVDMSLSAFSSAHNVEPFRMRVRQIETTCGELENNCGLVIQEDVKSVDADVCAETGSLTLSIGAEAMIDLIDRDGVDALKYCSRLSVRSDDGVLVLTLVFDNVFPPCKD